MESIEKQMLDVMKAGPDTGSLPDPIQGQFLPKEVSAKIVKDIEYQVVMRKYVSRIVVPGRYLVIPRISWGGDALKAYKIDYASAADYNTKAQADFATGSLTLKPEMLVARTELLEHDLDFATVDLSAYIMEQLTRTIARAEEKALILGTAGNGDSYLNLFKGVTQIPNVVTDVTYADSDDYVDKISDAINKLGVYGEDRGQLVLLVSNTVANRLRKSAKILNVGYYDPKAVSIVREGGMPMIHGVEVQEVPELETINNGEQDILMRRDFGLLGQRQGILFRRVARPDLFKIILVMSEFIDFTWQYVDQNNAAYGKIFIAKQ